MRRLLVQGAVLLGGALLAMLLYRVPVAAAGPDAPPVPHGTAGYEQCETCHGAQGIKPAPADHVAFPRAACAGCHSPAAAPLSPAAPSSPEDCLGCHSQPGRSMTLASGEKLSVSIDAKTFAASIHGNKLLCRDCHGAITGYPHPKRAIASVRDYSVAQYEVCKKCHFDNYTKTLDSVHYAVLSGGDTKAPLCTDCHGAHNVTAPAQPRARISLTCSQCHQGRYQEYASSVHGTALIQESNYDVPVCTDCHRSHTIEDPRTAAFRLKSVQICSNCHGNEKLMQKYDISTNVVQSYLQDFHGASVALIGKEGRDIWAREAVCTDCHGVHNIQKADSPDSPVIKENVLAACQKCHADAAANFPGAWLSHYEPSIQKAPLVFFTRLFYRMLIPFILLGLSAHVLLDLWRAVTNR